MHKKLLSNLTKLTFSYENDANRGSDKKLQRNRVLEKPFFHKKLSTRSGAKFLCICLLARMSQKGRLAIEMIKLLKVKCTMIFKKCTWCDVGGTTV